MFLVAVCVCQGEEDGAKEDKSRGEKEAKKRREKKKEKRRLADFPRVSSPFLFVQKCRRSRHNNLSTLACKAAINVSPVPSDLSQPCRLTSMPPPIFVSPRLIWRQRPKTYMSEQAEGTKKEYKKISVTLRLFYGHDRCVASTSRPLDVHGGSFAIAWLPPSRESTVKRGGWWRRRHILCLYPHTYYMYPAGEEERSCYGSFD